MSREAQYTIRLTLTDPYGKEWSVIMPVDAFDARDRWENIKPIGPFCAGQISLDDAVRIVIKREYRKDDFEQAARQLARALGERMEDEDGWHGVERQERYKQMRRDGKS